MTKNKYAVAFSAIAAMGAGVLVSNGAYAENVILESCDGLEDCAVVTSTDELKEAFTAEKSVVIVGSSFTLTDDVVSSANTSFYLNNYTITSNNTSGLNVSGDMTLYAGAEGLIDYTKTSYSAVYIISGGHMTMTGGTIRSAYKAVSVWSGSFTMDGGALEGDDTVTVNDNSSFTFTDGTVTATGNAFAVFKNAVFTMDGGTITAGNIGVGGNAGTGEGAVFNLNAGTINSDSHGVFAPQTNGKTTIKEGFTINADKTGVELRAGELEITGGTIATDTNTVYEVTANGNGYTTVGAAIAIAQHTTKQPITVTISGGTFTGTKAFSERNIQENSAEDVAKITAQVTGGTFNGGIVTEDLTDFMAGGLYTVEPTEDEIIEDHETEYNDDEGAYEVLPINVNYKDDYLEDGGGEEGHVSATVEFGDDFVADRKAELVATEVAIEGLALDEEEGGELVFAADITVVDRNGEEVPVEENSLTLYIDITDEQYETLSQYDRIQVVYFDEDGVEVERFDAELRGEAGGYYVVFTSTHLSTYGVVGVDDPDAPDTGRFTVVTASASAATIMTSVMVGMMVSVLTFVKLRRIRIHR